MTDDMTPVRRVSLAFKRLASIAISRMRRAVGGLLQLVVHDQLGDLSERTERLGSASVEAVSKKLASMIPAERRDSCCILDLEPVGRFLTYGVGVSLMQMRDPVAATGRVAVR